jgi:hypothetical protein
MPEKVQKSITVKQSCINCEDVFFKRNIVVDVPVDYKVSDIKKQLNPPPKNCPECNQIVTASFSFVHVERL